MNRARAWLQRKGSALILVAIVLCMSGASLFWSARQQDGYEASLRHERVVQQQAGELIEQRLCTTLGRLTALMPPAGPAAANPSRAYEQELHATLAQLGPDIGCKEG